MRKMSCFLLSAALLMLPGTARADWIEIGDAGQTLGTAQVITSFGGTNRITGTLNPSIDVDLYAFIITSPTSFVATLLGQAERFRILNCSYSILQVVVLPATMTYTPVQLTIHDRP